MSRIDGEIGNGDKKQRPVPDHDRIVRGVPYNGPAEGPCAGPVLAREWQPEPHEIYPNGPWELVNFVTGNADDGHGGAIRCWVHATYRERCQQGKYLRGPVRDQFGGQ